jgi:hypothetical protein
MRAERCAHPDIVAIARSARTYLGKDIHFP